MVLVQPLTELTTCLRLRDGDRHEKTRERLVGDNKVQGYVHVPCLSIDFKCNRLKIHAVTVKISHLAEDHHWNYKIKATFN